MTYSASNSSTTTKSWSTSILTFSPVLNPEVTHRKRKVGTARSYRERIWKEEQPKPV